METKSIKIPIKVHKELKVFTAQHEDNMIEFAGFAIMKELAARGHHFIFKPTDKFENGVLKTKNKSLIKALNNSPYCKDSKTKKPKSITQ